MKWSATYQAEDTSGARLQVSERGLQAFVEADFGLSVHWGLYALHGGGPEWMLYSERIPFEIYQQRMQAFNPTRFDAEEWGDLMLEAGCKFLLITSKHHDGFCMFDTALTDWKVTNTAFGRDPIAELSRALQARGLGLRFYYSLLDWTHPAYRHDWPAYVAYYQGQLRELLTNYGPISGIVFDGYWPRTIFEPGEEIFPPRGPWDLAGTYDLIHSLQPDCTVINNHHILPLRGEDAQVGELDFPGENTTGFGNTEIGPCPQAVWWNLNSGWAYNARKHNVKPAEEILGTLRRCREIGAVFMLNVGPRGFGDIHPDEARVLREIGTQLRREGSA